MTDTNTPDPSGADDDGVAAVPENGAFDGDSSTEALAGGVAQQGHDALPDSDSQPAQDGGVMGAMPENASISPAGVELDGDRDAGLPPEEMGR